MSDSEQTLPSTASHWGSLMGIHNPKMDIQKPMEYMRMSSASKMKFSQFLMLRVLWDTALKADDIWSYCKSRERAESADQAKLFLKHFTDFQQYLTMIDETTSLKADSSSTHQSVKTAGGRRVPNPGAKSNTFSLVLHQQRSCTMIKERGFDEEDIPSKVIVAPFPSSRPSTSGSAAITGAMDALKIDSNKSTQNPPSQAPPSQTVVEDFLEQLETQSTQSGPSTTLTDRFAQGGPLLPISGDEVKDFDIIEDEQIINSALISFLQALTMHHPEVKGEWGYFRHPFVLINQSKEKLYEARVDGLFRTNGSPSPQIIAEVKPYLRNSSNTLRNKILIQEGAQMAAWIASHPPPAITNRGHKYQRLLISQDRHEVYITVATFDLLYVQYIQGLSTGQSFLGMNQHGPFLIDNRDHMELLARIMLAFSLEGGLD